MPRLIIIFLLLLALLLNRSYAHIYATIGQANLPNPSPKEYSIGQAPTKFKYVALGDSLTAGIGTDNINQTFPFQVSQKLALKNTVTTVNLANSGATSQELIDNQLQKAILEKPDFVTVLIGINDIHNLVSTSQFQKNLDQILKQLKTTNTKIVVINLPFLGGPSLVKFPYNYLLALRTKQFNQIIKKEATQYNVQLVDLYSNTLELKSNDNLYSKDDFHPSSNEYIIWGKIINGSYNW